MKTIELSETEERALTRAIYQAIGNSEHYIEEKKEHLRQLNRLDAQKYEAEQNVTLESEITHWQWCIDSEENMIKQFKKLFEKIHLCEFDKIPF